MSKCSAARMLRTPKPSLKWTRSDTPFTLPALLTFTQAHPDLCIQDVGVLG
jgi:hypothetical protein